MGVGGGGRLVRAGGRERCGERPSTCHGGKREGMVVVANAKKKTAAQKWMRTTKGGAGRERVDGGGAVGGNAVATVSMEGSIATDIPTAVSRVLVGFALLLLRPHQSLIVRPYTVRKIMVSLVDG